jgi:hypothetical protein
MIKLSDLQNAINGVNHTPALDPASIDITGGYVCDMLSDVMGSAKEGQAWITIMKHLNTIAVASMTGIPAIILAKGNAPDASVTEKAEAENICIISSEMDTFKLAGTLYGLLNR